MSKNGLSGVAAKQRAKVLTNHRTGKPRGKGIPLVSYPRLQSRTLIVRTAKKAGVRVSNWVIVTCLEKIAREMGATVEKLIPAAEFQELQRTRGKA